MELERKDIHDIKNQLAISIGMVELAQKMILRDGKEADFTKLNERLDKALMAQRKLQDFFEGAMD